MSPEAEIQDRIRQLKLMDVAYYADDPSVSDAFYDDFRDETRRLAPDHPYFKEVGSPVQSAWSKVRLSYPMGSLDKAQTEAEFRAWCPSKPLFGSLKLDGISILLRYENGKLVLGATRGDGEVGEDITDNVRKMRGVPKNLKSYTGFVRGEIILKKSVFEEHFKAEGYKNCRNAAGGAAKDLEGGKCHLLDVICYQIRPDAEACRSREDEFLNLRMLGFKTAGQGWPLTSVEDAVVLYRGFVDGRRAALDFDIDGLVVEVDDTDAREAMGGDARPNGARAFKFPHERAETTLRDIVWQVGASGRITPVAVFDPVELAGATVKQASLHNVANIYRLIPAGLCRDDVIVVSRRNDVIPYVEEVIKNRLTGGFRAPIRCPVCDTATTMDGEYLICPNKTDCAAQTEGAVKRWLVKVGVKDFGGALVEAVCQANIVSEPADLYRLGVDQVAGLQVGGRKVGKFTATTALKNLNAKKCLPLHVLVGSLGIPLWSRSMVKVLVADGYDSIEKMDVLVARKDAWWERVTGWQEDDDGITVGTYSGMAGVGETKARAFVDGFVNVRQKISNLIAVGVTVAPEATGSMKGQSVCMTGFRDTAMEAAVEVQGGTVKSSVGKGLTYLVAKDPTGKSGKLAAARENGTKVVGVEEMWALLGGRKS